MCPALCPAFLKRSGCEPLVQWKAVVGLLPVGNPRGELGAGQLMVLGSVSGLLLVPLVQSWLPSGAGFIAAL